MDQILTFLGDPTVWNIWVLMSILILGAITALVGVCRLLKFMLEKIIETFS